MNILRPLRMSFEAVKENKKRFFLLVIIQSILLGSLYFLNELPQISFEEINHLSMSRYLTSFFIFLLRYVVSPLFVALPLISAAYFKTRSMSYMQRSTRVALYYCTIGILFELYQVVSSWLLAEIYKTPQLLMLLGPIILVLTFLFIPIWVVCRYFGVFYLLSGKKIKSTFQTILSSFKSHPFKKLLQICIINLTCNFPAFIFDTLILLLGIKHFNIYVHSIKLLLESFAYIFMILCFYTIWKNEWEN